MASTQPTRPEQSARTGEGAVIPQQRGYEPAETEMTGWTGWVVFAGVMMVVLGFFHVIQGITALVNSGYYVVTESDLVVQINFTAWGWVHLGVGIVVLLAGIAVMSGQMWARVVGIAFAVLSAIVNIGFLAAFPLLSAIIIAVDVVVIYALAVHGGELRPSAA